MTWSRYLSLVVTAYNSQVHGSTVQVLFAFVSPRRLTPVAIERLTNNREAGEVLSPRQEKEQFLQRLDSLVPLVRETMEKAQARYNRPFDKRARPRRESHRVGECVYVNLHENHGGKLVFKTLGPYHVLKTDGRRLTIESDEGIRTINGNHATGAKQPPEGDPAWARALAAWRVPSLPSSASKPLAGFDHFVGKGYDELGHLMLKMRWFGYGPREASWHYEEDIQSEKVRQYCKRHPLQVRRRASTAQLLVRGGNRGSRRSKLRSRRPPRSHHPASPRGPDRSPT